MHHARRAFVVLLISATHALPAQPGAPTASFRGGGSHLGVYSGGGMTIAGLQWRFLTNGDVISSPAVVGNSVYVGSGDGHLYALDRLTGKQLWSYDAGSAIMSSPAVANGLVVVGTYDGRFMAIDVVKGTLRWRLSTGPTLPFPWGHESGDRYTSSANIVGGVVVFGAGDGNVYSVDVASGHVRWRASTGGRVRGTPAVADGAVFVGSFDGRVYSFDLATGKQRWRYDTEGVSLNSGKFGFDRRSIQSSPSVSNGVVFIGARDGFVYALGAADGKLRWRYDHEVSWINSSPAVADGVVYDGSSDAHFVQALDAATGRELWRTNVGSTVWSSPSVAGDQIYLGDGSGRVRVLDRRNGHELATFVTGAGVFSSPVVSGNLLFVGGADGGVYALRLSNDPAVQRAVFLDSAYVRADAAGRSVELTTFLTHRGYTALDPTSIAAFLHARIADKAPSVVVFATDHLPSSLDASPPQRSIVRQYLEAGGKVVWTGIPPLLWSLDSAGKFPGLGGYKWDAPTDLLGVSHSATIFDARGVRATEEGVRWGQPRIWRSSWGVDPSGVTHVLGVDDWGLAAAWVKSYGGPEGTGFVRASGDDFLAVYLAAEFRPAR
jgi:outer membrane protein assembly factor BamB